MSSRQAADYLVRFKRSLHCQCTPRRTARAGRVPDWTSVRFTRRDAGLGRAANVGWIVGLQSVQREVGASSLSAGQVAHCCSDGLICLLDMQRDSVVGA